MIDMSVPATTVLEELPFHKPDIDGIDRRAIGRVLSSGWLTTGKEAAAFEEEFKAYTGARAALAVSSCTAALHLALVLAGVSRRGHKVIVPSLTFTATAAAVLMAGGTPVFADVSSATLTLTGETCDRAFTPDVVAVVPMHYGGNPSGFESVCEWAASRRTHVMVVDDAAHALPASTPLGRIGSAAFPGNHVASCFSFYPTKPITTAEGGMLTLTEEWMLDRARRLSLHGIDQDAYQRSRTGLYHYEVTEHGWKYNLPDLLAALGRTQLGKANELHRRRKFIAAWYGNRLVGGLERDGWLTRPVVYPGHDSAWHLYVVHLAVERFATGWTRDRVAETLKREYGVGTSLHYRPLHLHPFWRPFAEEGHLREPTVRFNNTEHEYQRILSLPIWPGMTETDVGRVVGALEAVIREAAR